MSDMTIENLLGGRTVLDRPIKSDMDLYELGRSGLSKRSLLCLAKNINMSVHSIAEILNVTERTLQRKQEADVLGVDLSEHIIQIAEVYSRGDEVFANLQDFQTWVQSPSQALNGRKPVELLSSRFGALMVLDELGRIAHGVFS